MLLICYGRAQHAFVLHLHCAFVNECLEQSRHSFDQQPFTIVFSVASVVTQLPCAARALVSLHLPLSHAFLLRMSPGRCNPPRPSTAAPSQSALCRWVALLGSHRRQHQSWGGPAAQQSVQWIRRRRLPCRRHARMPHARAPPPFAGYEKVRGLCREYEDWWASSHAFSVHVGPSAVLLVRPSSDRLTPGSR